MSRIYQHTLELLPQIKEMLAKGKTHKEIEDALGLVGDRPIHNLLKIERRKEKRGVSTYLFPVLDLFANHNFKLIITVYINCFFVFYENSVAFLYLKSVNCAFTAGYNCNTVLFICFKLTVMNK